MGLILNSFGSVFYSECPLWLQICCSRMSLSSVRQYRRTLRHRKHHHLTLAFTEIVAIPDTAFYQQEGSPQPFAKLYYHPKVKRQGQVSMSGLGLYIQNHQLALPVEP